MKGERLRVHGSWFMVKGSWFIIMGEIVKEDKYC